MRFRSQTAPPHPPPCRWALPGLLMGLVLLAALLGCAPRERQAQTTERALSSRTEISPDIASASAVDSLIAPYRRALGERMNEVLARCPVEMDTGSPEGLLGAMVADLVLERARRETSLPVDACVLNNGGLRAAWTPGEITVGSVYEVMPFDNTLVVLRLDSEQLRLLADQIARRRGEPVAGLSFTIRNERAADLRVGGEAPRDRDYWIATNSYLAFGGGAMSVLWEPREMRQTGVFIRDAILDGVQSYGAAAGDAAGGRGEIPMPRMGRIRSED